MPEYLSPGVYIEEVAGNQPIEGVSTSIAGMVGVTERGPVNWPILLTGFAQYKYWFGQYLDIGDFSNATGALCYLPHAVEGFFTNGGQQLYLTRILDTDAAVLAATTLYDRGTAASADTVLLRAAGELSGTAANPPLLYVLDDTGIIAATATDTADAYLRIGDGSAAEYKLVDSFGSPAATHVPLDAALARTHAAGAAVVGFAGGTAHAGITGPVTLDTGTAASLPSGAQTITISSTTPADIPALAGMLPVLVQVDAAPSVEYRFATAATPTGAATATLQLDSPLLLQHAANAAITILADPPAPAGATLETDATAGATVAFVLDQAGNFPVNNLIVFEPGSSAQEARVVGELTVLDLVDQAYASYPTGSLVQQVTIQDEQHALTAAIPAATTAVVPVQATKWLVPGQKVQVTEVGPPLAAPERATIKSVDTALQVTLAANLVNAHTTSDNLLPAAKNTTKDAPAGSAVLALDDRMGLQIGDVLRVDSGAAAEYVSIRLIPNRAPIGITMNGDAYGAAPDAGTVVLNSPLDDDHPAGTRVWRETEAVGATHPTVLALAANTGDGLVVVTSGAYVADSFVRITVPTGAVYRHEIGSVPTISPGYVTIDTPLERPHPVGSPVVGRKGLIDVQALDPGAWGNRLRISVQDEPKGLVAQTPMTQMVSPTMIYLGSVAGVEPGTILEMLDPTGTTLVDPSNPLKVTLVDRTQNYAVHLDPLTALSALQQAAINTAVAPNYPVVRSREFSVTVLLLVQPDLTTPSRDDNILASEVFHYLSMDPRHSHYVETVIGATDAPLSLADNRPQGSSWYIRVYDRAQNLTEPLQTTTLESVRYGPETLVDVLPSGLQRPARQALEDGDDSVDTITDNTYVGADSVDPANRTGLYSLNNVTDISMVAIPGRITPVVQQAVITHCELDGYRFAVLDGPAPPNDSLTSVQTLRQNYDTEYAALYHPWLLIPDPFPTNLASIAAYPIPPSGHTLGIYANVDITDGVQYAPANQVVRGIIGLQRTLNKSEQDILNPFPVNINVIRDFRVDDRGIRVYGARVITSDTDWKYVNVRRLMNYIEKSLYLGLQWAVFLPNEESLWKNVVRSITAFLTTVWRNGGLVGDTADLAFYAKCDATTMTQDDMDNGRLIALVGVVPVKPAEYVIIRIGFLTSNASS